jgi:formate/nitrite transporter FocA (FNT family)
MASASTSFPGKMLAAWLAVSTFTAIGFEHRWAECRAASGPLGGKHPQP